MATQTVEFLAVYGQTLTAKLFAVGSDTLGQTASAVTEQTNRIGVYRATFTDAPAGEYELHVATSGGIPVARWYVTLTLTTATFPTYETAVRSVTARVTANTDQWGGVAVTGMPMPTYTQPTGFLAATFPAAVSSYSGGAVASVTGAVGSVASPVTVGTNNDKTGYTLTVTPPTAAAIADAVWDELYSGHTTTGSYGHSVLIAANSNRTVQVTGSNHVAADIHELQPAVIDSTHFAANWLTAAGTAADYITELQTAIGTATNQTTILDRLGYTLAALVGTISDAQTAAETYAITLGANTFTVDFTGLDASGNRTGQTLTKV